MRTSFTLTTLLIILLTFALTPPLLLFTTVSAESPQLDMIAYYYYVPLIDSNPHGKLNLIVDIYLPKNDGNSDYDWYFYN